METPKGIRFPEPLRQRIEEHARSIDRDFSWVVREACESYLAPGPVQAPPKPAEGGTVRRDRGHRQNTRVEEVEDPKVAEARKRYSQAPTSVKR